MHKLKRVAWLCARTRHVVTVGRICVSGKCERCCSPLSACATAVRLLFAACHVYLRSALCSFLSLWILLDPLLAVLRNPANSFSGGSGGPNPCLSASHNDCAHFSRRGRRPRLSGGGEHLGVSPTSRRVCAAEALRRFSCACHRTRGPKKEPTLALLNPGQSVVRSVRSRTFVSAVMST